MFLLTMADPETWQILFAAEIQGLMNRLRFDLRYMVIGEIPDRRFSIRSRVVSFESDADFMSFLRFHFCKPPVAPFDSSSSSVDMSDSGSDCSSSFGVRGIIEEDVNMSGGEAETSTSSPIHRSRATAPKKVRACTNRTDLDPASDKVVQRWAATMGIDLEDYQIHVVDGPVDRKSLRKKKDVVSFYRAHFEVGLRLPLDPFICEFLERTSVAPIDINLHTMWLLVCFAIVCWALSFEPRLPIFLHFFQIQKGNEKQDELIVARTRPNGAQLFADPPNKMPKWNEKYLLVECRQGWNFSIPRTESGREGVEKIKITSDVEVAARDALREYLGIQVDERGRFVSQQRKFEWSLLVDPEDDYWLIRAGIKYLSNLRNCKKLRFLRQIVL